MDCDAPSAVEAPVESLLATVAALERGGEVVVGVVGRGTERLRAAVPLESPGHHLTVADTAPLEDVASRMFPVAGRCVVVARREGPGWSFVVASPGLGALEDLAPPSAVAAPPAVAPPPAVTPRLSDGWRGPPAALTAEPRSADDALEAPRVADHFTMAPSSDREDWYGGWTAVSHVSVGLIATGAVVMPSGLLLVPDTAPALQVGGLVWGMSAGAFVVPLAGPSSLLAARSAQRHGAERLNLAPGIVATALIPVSEILMLGTAYGYTDAVRHEPMLVFSAFLVAEAALVEWQLHNNRRARSRAPERG